MRVTVLGCGGSGGVPLIGGEWGACDPANPRNRRRRASILVEHGDAAVLVDASPDCRQQLLDAGIRRLDAVLFTHAHADHCHGIDDLRWVNYAMQADLAAYGDSATYRQLKERFAYAFAPLEREANGYYYRPVLRWAEIAGPFSISGIPVLPFRQDHGYTQTLGYRFGAVAYSTDVVRLDEAAFAALAGVEVWIVGCLRERAHPTHAHLARVLEWVDRVGPRRAILTHMNHTLDYADLAARLPEGVEPAYDMMRIEV